MSELWRETFGERIMGSQDLVEEQERGFDLELMRCAAAAIGLIKRPFRWQVFERKRMN